MSKSAAFIRLLQKSFEVHALRPALQIGSEVLSYQELQELQERANSTLGQFLGQKLIAILAHREIEAYAGILAVIQSGRTYVPISPKDPPARVAKKLEQIGCTTIISSSRHLEREQEIAKHSSVPLKFIDLERGEEQPPVEFNEEHAYIMFTSGTTGEPKAVPVKRSSVEHYVRSMNELFDFSPEDRFTQLFDLSFDLSVHDLFVCWSNGACLCVPDTDDVFKWPAFVREAKPTVWFSVPSVVRTFARFRVLKENAFPSIRLSLFCGEALFWKDLEPWRKAVGTPEMANIYGPTECTIAVGTYKIQEMRQSGIVPIGFPLNGHEFKVEKSRDSEEGIGELLVAGPQVFDGYIGVEEADQPFIQEDGKRWYKTGDEVRIDETGLAHFIGRVDDQVKIRGHRVELGEIDTVLSAVLGSARSISLRVPQGNVAKTIAFIEGEFNAEELLEHCRTELPPHMHPDGFISVDVFPLNANGKVDKISLVHSFK